MIYLDEPKMYSISSQIFEGMTEYLLKEVTSTTEQSEEQKGPIASGRIVADAMRQHQTAIEKRVLHDYAFAAFEQKLFDDRNILDIDAGCEIEKPFSLTSHSFVRICATAKFVDARKLSSLLQMFNKLGESLAYVTSNAKRNEVMVAMQLMKQSMSKKGELADLAKTQKGIERCDRTSAQKWPLSRPEVFGKSKFPHEIRIFGTTRNPAIRSGSLLFFKSKA